MEHKIIACRYCNASITFLRTKNNKFMPVDIDSVDPDDIEYDSSKHAAHFANCGKD